jgi:hypothetical protein
MQYTVQEEHEFLKNVGIRELHFSHATLVRREGDRDTIEY